ncbi:quinone-dependent dihydroorotate dehydrogenase [Maricaulis parjimensis]|uniref:quinone-dependent dihydroorotate dehydrogenase n=1 Tax=Maricaulis parjimensis TaxID=144023 RepID=UPI001939CD0B|nr:quinone-dependent dihydroorotate dehydrogenase [Maricaulis parjimensis]
MLHDLATTFLRGLDPEQAHKLTLMGLKAGLGPKEKTEDDPVLATSLAGIALTNPVGLAAGFDKNADAPDALLAMGFGFVECGAVTPRPQDGKPRPRIFRLEEDEAVINRMGFPNLGLEHFRRQLQRRSGRPGLVGVNLGANLDSEDRVADYVACLKELRGLAGFYTVNVSSPNTPGLRTLQASGALDELLARVVAVRDEAPVFIKIAPDIEDREAADIVAAIGRHGLNGVIVSNTSITRPESLQSDKMGEAGGLSGPPIFQRSTDLVREFRHVAGPDLAIIGVGGVDSPETAYAKIRAGANAIQLYTGLVYHGPSLITEIKEGLVERLQADGFASVADAVGVG